jgi:hypothetical protein
MTKRITALTSAVLLALGIAAFTGSARAANGNNGNGKGQAAQATPPGQAKKDASAPTAAKAKGGGSASQNAGAQSGVKPTNATAKGTTCTTGGGRGSSATCKATGSGAANALSAGKTDSSKRYGNGSTAAQIANSRGAPANTTLSGPGNSQPHKVWDCRMNHWVDVHAVKSYSCLSRVSTASQAKNTRSSSHSTGASPTSGGVLGVTASQQSQPVGGVLGVIQSVGQGTLPFTGFPLWVGVLAAIGLIVLGLGLRHRARATI